MQTKKGYFLNWKINSILVTWAYIKEDLEVNCFLFFSGIPAMVDFAAMREAVKTLGGDPKKVHPACPTDLTVDHSLQIDFNKWYFNTDIYKNRHASWLPASPLEVYGIEERE